MSHQTELENAMNKKEIRDTYLKEGLLRNWKEDLCTKPLMSQI